MRDGIADATINAEQYAALSLREVASWQSKAIAGGTKPVIVAGIPSLQRGAVWNAGQVEMLWDSMMRGFPVGSLVVCKRLHSQSTRVTGRNNDWESGEIEYHLLDGQQRSNAIALGFLDPTLIGDDEADIPAALWLELGHPRSSPGSTREFLFRVLTRAHPWGYQPNDAADRLSAEQIRKACETCAGDTRTRPRVSRAWPSTSPARSAPLPVAWLLDAALVQDLHGRQMWEHLIERCKVRSDLKWTTKTLEIMALSESAPAHIERGLARLRTTRIIVLKVAQEVLDEDATQEPDAAPVDPSVSSIEHLFQRLNSAGTILRGEELAFSMIKAYWPRIEDSFGAIRGLNDEAQQPMPGSHLAALGARAALIGTTGRNKLPPPLSISRIRSLAHLAPRAGEKQRVLAYLGISPAQGENYAESDLHRNLRQVDDWLLYREKDREYGLPPVLRTGIARGSPDLYLLLLHFAQRVRESAYSAAQIDALSKPLLALATAVHWFSDNPEKAVEAVFGAISTDPVLSPESFHRVLHRSKQTLGLRDPALLDALIPAPTMEGLRGWRLWNSAKAAHPRGEPGLTEDWPFLHRVISKRNLLLYAQRRYMFKAFPTYDPAQVDTWKETNRPWDFDHILPSALLYNRRNAIYKSACDEWVDTIGNLRAWPMEQNRSKGKDPATVDASQCQDSFLNDGHERLAFMATDETIDTAKPAFDFMSAARTRTFRIYAQWFEQLEVGKLL
jgi:hypothetical protein